MIIAVVLDTSASAAARSASGLSALDAAKSAAEHFYKCRSRDVANAQMQLQFHHQQFHHLHLLPPPQADTFILATADAGAPIKAIDRGTTISVNSAFPPGQQQQEQGEHAGRQIQQHRKWHAALKAASAGDASAVGAGVRAALDVISLLRQGAGADTHGCGWTPAQARPWCVVVFTDGGSWSWPDGSLATASSVARGCVASLLSSSNASSSPPLLLPSAASLAPLVGLHLLPSSAPPPFGELTASPFRWDGRVCGAVLRLPGVIDEEEDEEEERGGRKRKERKKRELRNPSSFSALDAASALCGESEEERDRMLSCGVEEAAKQALPGRGLLQQQQQRQKQQKQQQKQRQLLRDRRRFPFRKSSTSSASRPSPALVGAELACVCEASGGKAVEARSLRALLSWVEQLSTSLVARASTSSSSFASSAAVAAASNSTAPLRLVVNFEPTLDAFAAKKKEGLAAASNNAKGGANEGEEEERERREEEEEERARCSARTIAFLGSSLALQQQQKHQGPAESGSNGAPLWPVPEAFSAEGAAALAPRAAFPTLTFVEPSSSSCGGNGNGNGSGSLTPGTAAWPTPPPGFPLDTYEVEGALPARVVAGLRAVAASAAAAAAASAAAANAAAAAAPQQQPPTPPLAGWPVYVANSLGDGGGLGDACGLLHVSPRSNNDDDGSSSPSSSTRVFLTLLPYNFPMLFRLLDALSSYPGGARLAPPPAWRAEFSRYLRAAPAPAVAAPLRQALSRLGLPVHLVPELRDGGLPPNLGAFLRRVQAGARGEVERAEASASAAAAAASGALALPGIAAPRITVDPSAVPGPGALLQQLASLARGAASAIWESAAENEEKKRRSREGEKEKGGGESTGRRLHHRNHRRPFSSHSSSWSDHAPGGRFAVPVSDMGDYSAAAAASPSRVGASAAARPLRDASAAAAAALGDEGEAAGLERGTSQQIPFGNPFAADAARRGARRSRSRSRSPSMSPAPQQQQQGRQEQQQRREEREPFADEAAGEAAAAFGGQQKKKQRSSTPPPPPREGGGGEGDGPASASSSSAASPASTSTAVKPIQQQVRIVFFLSFPVLSFFSQPRDKDRQKRKKPTFPPFPPSNSLQQAANPEDEERADAMWAEMLAARRSSSTSGAAGAATAAAAGAAAAEEDEDDGEQKKKQPQQPRRQRPLPRPLPTPAGIDRLVGALSLFSEAASSEGRKKEGARAAEEVLTAALREGGGKKKKDGGRASAASARPFPGNARVWASVLARIASERSSSSSLARALRKVASAAKKGKDDDDGSDNGEEEAGGGEEEEEEKGTAGRRASKRARN